MNDAPAGFAPDAPLTLHCTQCGNAMRIAREHTEITVVCPHCGELIEPWRLKGLRNAQPQPPAPPPRPAVPPGPRAPEYQRGWQQGYVYGPDGQVLYSWRNRWVAGLLGVFLGYLGVHRFYLGFTGIGVLQLVVSFTGIGALWGIIDGILCLCGALRDVDGYPLRE